MKQGKEPRGGIFYYLCKNNRYKLSLINSIDYEDILLRSPILRKASLFTLSYIYIFEKEEDEEEIDAAIFKERVPQKKSNLGYLKKLEYQVHGGGYDYLYSEEDMKLDYGDYPKFPERIKRYKKMLNIK